MKNLRSRVGLPLNRTSPFVLETDDRSLFPRVNPNRFVSFELHFSRWQAFGFAYVRNPANVDLHLASRLASFAVPGGELRRSLQDRPGKLGQAVGV
jgi:hypothetical protein